MSIHISIRELGAAKSRLADTGRRVAYLRAVMDARQVAQANLAAALARHRDVLQNADLGLADKKDVEAARAEIHALRAEANKPDVAIELAEAEAELQRIRDDNGAAAVSVVRDLGEAMLARYRKAATDAIQAEAQLEGLRLAAQSDPARLGNLVVEILGRKRTTYQETVDLQSANQRTREEIRDFVSAAIHDASVPALPPGVD